MVVAVVCDARRPADANLAQASVESFLVAWPKEEEEPVDYVRLQGTPKEPDRPKGQPSGVWVRVRVLLNLTLTSGTRTPGCGTP